MIIYLPTKQTFTNQKEAKSYFGSHHYRRLVKKGDIYFTNYKHTVANDPVSYTHLDNKAAGEKFLAENKAKEGVVTTPSLSLIHI